MATKAELEAQVANLKAEVENLRVEVARQEGMRLGHICPSSLPQFSAVPPCTCGNTLPCQAHPAPWRGNVWVNGPAGMPPTVGSRTLTWCNLS